MSAALRILIVEDDELMAEVLAELVTQQSMIVVGPLATVRQALQVLDEVAIDAALLNVRLRGEFVFPVCEALTERQKPFAFISGSLGDVPEKFRQAPRLEKPCGRKEVVALLESFRNLAPV